MVGGSASYFTNDVPPSAPSGALSLRLVAAGISISNTVPSDAGYVVDTFDGTHWKPIHCSILGKGNLNSWDPLGPRMAKAVAGRCANSAGLEKADRPSPCAADWRCGSFSDRSL